MRDKRLIDAYDRIDLDPQSEERILSVLTQAQLPGKEPTAMKTKKVFRAALLAAVICVFCAATVFAISGIIHSTGTYPMAGTGEYTSLNALPEIEKRVGYEITAPRAFSNGYAFGRCTVTGEAAFDENNEVLREYYGVVIAYEKPGAETVTLNLSPVLTLSSAGERPAPTLTRAVDGVEVRYSLDHYKLVPPDYEKTAGDLAAEAAGHYYISFGSESIEEHDYEFASFVLNGAEYVIMDTNADGADALFRMAAEVIAAGK